MHFFLPLLICKSKTYLSLSLSLSVCPAVVLQAFWHAHQQYLSTKARERGDGNGSASNKGILSERRFSQRRRPLSQSAQVQERQAREVDHCLNFIENANANERDANICRNLILYFVPFSASQNGTGKFRRQSCCHTSVRQTLRSGKSCSSCL